MTALLAEVLTRAEALTRWPDLEPFLLGVAVTALALLGMIWHEVRVAKSRARSRMIRRRLTP